MPSLKEDLQSPDAYPLSSPKHVDFIETHISWLFLAGDEAYKVKKPVNFGFVDYSTMDLRKRFCEAEIRLNSRLSPHVYFGIVPITRSASGFHSVGGDGEIVDWAVHMTRLPDCQRADNLLTHGKLGFAEIDLLAKYLVKFHSSAKKTIKIGKFGKPELIELNLRENFHQTEEMSQKILTTQELKALQDWQLSFLQNHTTLFKLRIQNKRICDGHGDLRLEQIYFNRTGEITILDCIEFNDRLRCGDVSADLAFLSMDLNFHGRKDLAERLLACYARESNDYDLFSLIDFYESYRAYIRGKISIFRSRELRETRRYFLLALSALLQPVSQPILIGVGGTIATGKSTVSDWLGLQLGAPVIDSDRTRKHLIGAESTQFIKEPYLHGAYSLSLTDRVYTEMFRRAKTVLNSKRSVILEATFRSADQRKRIIEFAKNQGVPLRFIECQAPKAICLERLLNRKDKPTVSDARVQLFDEFSNHFELIHEFSPTEHLILDTSQSFETTTNSLSCFLNFVSMQKLA